LTLALIIYASAYALIGLLATYNVFERRWI
jgi:hypothetical protein